MNEQKVGAGALTFSPFMRILITVLVLLFAVPFPFLMASMSDAMGTGSVLMVIALEVFCVLILLAMWLRGSHARLTMRIGAGLLGLGLTASAANSAMRYLAVSSSAEVTSLRPVVGFVVVGVPCLIFAIAGRLPIPRSKSNVPSAASPSEEAVLIHLDGTGLQDEICEEYDLSSIEDQLDGILERTGLGTCDGNEIGPEGATLFLYGPSAERLFRAVEPTLRQYPLCKGARVVIRRGQPGAPQTELTL